MGAFQKPHLEHCRMQTEQDRPLSNVHKIPTEIDIVITAVLATSTDQVANYIVLIGMITRVQNCIRIRSRWTGGRFRGD